MAIIRAEKKKPTRSRVDDDEGLMGMAIADLGVKSVKSFTQTSKGTGKDKSSKEADKKKEKEEEERKKAEEAPKINYGSKKIDEVLDDINYARDRIFSKIVVAEDTSNISKKKKRKQSRAMSKEGVSVLNDTLDLNSTSPLK